MTPSETMSALTRARLWFSTGVFTLVPIGFLILVPLPEPGASVSAPSPWLRWGILAIALLALVMPFILERTFKGQLADALRARGTNPTLLIARTGILGGMAPWFGEFLLCLSGGKRADLYVITVICYVSLIYWAGRYRHLYFASAASS